MVVAAPKTAIATAAIILDTQGIIKITATVTLLSQDSNYLKYVEPCLTGIIIVGSQLSSFAFKSLVVHRIAAVGS